MAVGALQVKRDLFILSFIYFIRLVSLVSLFHTQHMQAGVFVFSGSRQ